MDLYQHSIDRSWSAKRDDHIYINVSASFGENLEVSTECSQEVSWSFGMGEAKYSKSQSLLLLRNAVIRMIFDEKITTRRRITPCEEEPSSYFFIQVISSIIAAPSNKTEAPAFARFDVKGPPLWEIPSQQLLKKVERLKLGGSMGFKNTSSLRR